jgi:hypothetical protein
MNTHTFRATFQWLGPNNQSWSVTVEEQMHMSVTLLEAIPVLALKAAVDLSTVHSLSCVCVDKQPKR